MAYTKVNWQNGVTPENATTLGQMDQGIADAHAGLPPTPVVNGQWIKGVGGVMTWAPIAAGDIPDLSATYQAKSEKAAASGYASLDAAIKVPVAQIPDLSATYQAKSEKAQANGYPSLDATGKVPAAQLPATGAAGIGTSLPASPADGQEYVLVDSLTAPTYQWCFRYIAAKATNKWVFVGGAAQYNGVQETGTTETTAGSAYVALATPGPIITVPVAGVYDVEIGAQASHGSEGFYAIMSYDIGATPASDNDSQNVRCKAGTDGMSAAIYRLQRKTLAVTTLTAKYKTNTSPAYFTKRWMKLTPVAVG